MEKILIWKSYDSNNSYSYDLVLEVNERDKAKRDKIIQNLTKNNYNVNTIKGNKIIISGAEIFEGPLFINAEESMDGWQEFSAEKIVSQYLKYVNAYIKRVSKITGKNIIIAYEQIGGLGHEKVIIYKKGEYQKSRLLAKAEEFREDFK